MSNPHPFQKLGDIANIEMGQSPASVYVHEELAKGLPFLQGCAEFGATNPIPKKSCSGLAKVGLSGSSLISVRAPVGALNKADQNYVIGRGLAAISARNGFSQAYLNYALEWSAKALHRVAQGSTFEAIGNKELRNLEIPVPVDFAEQEGIAAVLSALDEQIEATEGSVKKHKAIRDGMACEMFPSPDKLSQSGWTRVAISELGTIFTGNTPTPKNPSNYGGAVPFVTPADISDADFVESTEKTLSNQGMRLGRLANPGSIFCVCIGSTIGKLAAIQVSACTNQQINCLIPHDMGLSYFYLYAMRKYLKPQLLIEAGLQAVPIVNKSSFARLEIGIPPTTEDAFLIQEKLNSANSYIAKLQAESEKLQLLKKGLMHDLLTGKTRVTTKPEALQ